MGRLYYAEFDGVSVTAAQDLFEVIAPSDAIVVVHEVHVGQISDEGDAQAEMLDILMHRGTATGSGGSSVTPNPKEVGDAAFGGTCEANNTSQSVESAPLVSSAFNAQIGFFWTPTPEERPVVSPGGLFIVELQNAPADALTMHGYIVFEEIGG